jgi:hypothetical protein
LQVGGLTRAGFCRWQMWDLTPMIGRYRPVPCVGLSTRRLKWDRACSALAGQSRNNHFLWLAGQLLHQLNHLTMPSSWLQRCCRALPSTFRPTITHAQWQPAISPRLRSSAFSTSPLLLRRNKGGPKKDSRIRMCLN